MHFVPFPEKREKPPEYLHGPAASSWVLQYIMSVMGRKGENIISKKKKEWCPSLCCGLWRLLLVHRQVSFPLPLWLTPSTTVECIEKWVRVRVQKAKDKGQFQNVMIGYTAPILQKQSGAVSCDVTADYSHLLITMAIYVPWQFRPTLLQL